MNDKLLKNKKTFIHGLSYNFGYQQLEKIIISTPSKLLLKIVTTQAKSD